MSRPAYRKATPGIKSGIVKAFQSKIQNKRVTGKPYRKKTRKQIVSDEKRFLTSYYSNLLKGTPISKPKCACCGDSQIELLSLDHIGGIEIEGRKKGGKKLNSKQLYKWIMDHGMPKGFQVLCYNCNAGEGWHGGCPHKKKSKS